MAVKTKATSVDDPAGKPWSESRRTDSKKGRGKMLEEAA